jgi:hypothetical protein
MNHNQILLMSLEKGNWGDENLNNKSDASMIMGANACGPQPLVLDLFLFGLQDRKKVQMAT